MGILRYQRAGELFYSITLVTGPVVHGSAEVIINSAYTTGLMTEWSQPQSISFYQLNSGPQLSLSATDTSITAGCHALAKREARGSTAFVDGAVNSPQERPQLDAVRISSSRRRPFWRSRLGEGNGASFRDEIHAQSARAAQRAREILKVPFSASTGDFLDKVDGNEPCKNNRRV
jgi:hypothetical protein